MGVPTMRTTSLLNKNVSRAGETVDIPNRYYLKMRQTFCAGEQLMTAGLLAHADTGVDRIRIGGSCETSWASGKRGHVPLRSNTLGVTYLRNQ